MNRQPIRDAVATLLTPSGLLAIMLTIGVISMIMFSVEPPQYFVIVWSMAVGYFFKGYQVSYQESKALAIQEQNP